MKVACVFLFHIVNLSFAMGDPTFVPARPEKQEQEEVQRSKNERNNPKQVTSRASRNKKTPRKDEQDK